MNASHLTAWDLFTSGGPLMYPLLLCSILAIGIIMEKFYYFSRIEREVAGLKQKVFELIKNNQIKAAVEICDQSVTPMALVLRAGIIKFGSSKAEIEDSIQQAGLTQIPQLEHRMNALVTIAHISPLLGFLGTVAGLAATFHNIQQRAGSLNPLSTADLSSGIWQALLTTSVGLLVAIPAYVAYNYFLDRIDKYLLEMERSGAELVNFLYQLTEHRM